VLIDPFFFTSPRYFLAVTALVHCSGALSGKSPKSEHNTRALSMWG
jgi:hypothetical protein